MARRLQRLSAKQVEKQQTPGYYADGGNLWLQVTASGAKSWIFRFTLGVKSNGKPNAREMGLGGVNAVSLAEARRKAAACRTLLADGVDPIAARARQRSLEEGRRARSLTFEKCAEAYIKAHRASWRNAKHADQWENTLNTYCYPTIGSLAVADVDDGLVLRCLEPIWTAKHETATRVRQRVEAVLDWARARGYRSGENPARWKGHLDKLLPRISKKLRVRHHEALPYSEIAAFVKTLRTQEGVAARALEFTILTAARTGEVIGAGAEEFDLVREMWIVPKERMKAGNEHRVPLSAPALAIARAQVEAGSRHVFPGLKEQKPLSNMAMLALLKRMGRADLTVHGFRSTFRDWAAECTNYPSEVVEMALAHTVSDQVEAAYRRGDLLEKRRRLMDDWAKFCDRSSEGVVIPLGKKARAVSSNGRP